MARRAPQIHTKAVGSKRIVTVSFKNDLFNGELLTGIPTVTELLTSDLTITNISINSDEIEVNDVQTLPGQAVQFLVDAGISGTTYTLQIFVDTDSSPSQRLDGEIVLKVS